MFGKRNVCWGGTDAKPPPYPYRGTFRRDVVTHCTNNFFVADVVASLISRSRRSFFLNFASTSHVNRLGLPCDRVPVLNALHVGGRGDGKVGEVLGIVRY